MAQKLRDDKIGQLTHSAGNITMAASLSNPAYLTIGGQQYKVTSNLTVALPAMSANTRYQVFAVLNAGVVELRISQNENSVGPAGFNRWKLVGSLYANGLSSVAFGSFVNISGVPESLEFEYTPVWNNVVLGTGPIQTGSLRRKGSVAEIKVLLQLGTGGSVSGFIGTSLPTNLTTTEAENDVVLKGSGTVQDADPVGFYVVTPEWTAARIQVEFATTVNPGSAGSTNPITWGEGDRAILRCEIQISGWTNTPIEDL